MRTFRTGSSTPDRRDDADAQSSLTLVSSVIAQGFTNDGTSSPTQHVAGQTPSLTSTNNYINFCGNSSLPLATGNQISTGFCNPIVMGAIPSTSRMPSAKFTYPRNGDFLAPNAPMILGLAIINLSTGSFTNEETNYMSAPQQLDSDGTIKGHPFVVIEELTDPSQPSLTDPNKFTFCKGLTGVADSSGVLNSSVPGLQPGFYRMSSMIVAINSQPVALPVVQRGAVDDAIFVS
ncbi:hypothetical protein GGX14DRAFT_369872 [Mycena pura]|uniref:Uncharacterized protein n=1 Tax=Mycena pura TaxID=153505 RepID=A0AAD6V5Q3_9AGAR|nr:hypothetical protein GGX14DRAFT_369872 [Mycena pura]